jgi:hypothetical protein
VTLRVISNFKGKLLITNSQAPANITVDCLSVTIRAAQLKKDITRWIVSLVVCHTLSQVRQERSLQHAKRAWPFFS